MLDGRRRCYKTIPEWLGWDEPLDGPASLRKSLGLGILAARCFLSRTSQSWTHAAQPSCPHKSTTDALTAISAYTVVGLTTSCLSAPLLVSERRNPDGHCPQIIPFNHLVCPVYPGTSQGPNRLVPWPNRPLPSPNPSIPVLSRVLLCP